MSTKFNPNTHGFPSASEFMRTVKGAAYGVRDGRLMGNAILASASGASESLGADGGFLVPPEYRDRINQVLQASLQPFALADQQPMNSSELSFANDASAPWDTTRGIQPRWIAEGTTFGQSIPEISMVSLKARKLSALVPFSEELDDDSNFARLVGESAPRAIGYAIGAAMIDGSGVGQPQGVLRSGALVTVAAESGQTADTINGVNIAKMWSRLWTGGYASAVWMTHPDALTQLSGLGANIFTPGDDGAPAGRLMGRPIIPHEACAQLGDIGDIALCDFGEYLIGLRSPEVRKALSLDVWFDRSLGAFRFSWRMDGISWWSKPITSRVGGNTRSPFVTLGAR